VERLFNRVAGFRIDLVHHASQERNRADRAEVEAANIEVASHEKSLIERRPEPSEALQVRGHRPESNHVASPGARFEVAEFHCRAQEVHIATQRSTRVFKRRRQGLSVARLNRTIDGAVCKYRSYLARPERAETAARHKTRALLFGDGQKVFLRGGVDVAGLGILELICQSQTLEEFQGIAC